MIVVGRVLKVIETFDFVFVKLFSRLGAFGILLRFFDPEILVLLVIFLFGLLILVDIRSSTNKCSFTLIVCVIVQGACHFFQLELGRAFRASSTRCAVLRLSNRTKIFIETGFIILVSCAGIVFKSLLPSDLVLVFGIHIFKSWTVAIKWDKTLLLLFLIRRLFLILNNTSSGRKFFRLRLFPRWELLIDEFLYQVGVNHSWRKIYQLRCTFLILDFWYISSLRELILCVFFVYEWINNPIYPSLREVVILVQIFIELREDLLLSIYAFHG